MTDSYSAKLPGGGRIDAERHGRKFLVRRYDGAGNLRSVNIENELPDELSKSDLAKRGAAGDPSFRHARNGEILI